MIASAWHRASAHALADSVNRGDCSAMELIEASLSRIAATDAAINAFTDVVAERARKHAAAFDRTLASARKRSATTTRERWPLAGVPFAVKNLFDVAGLTTRAGSKIEREKPAAMRDATLVRRMEAAGAIVVGALNMDEYAYGFTTENSHDGPVHNPHDLSRIAGGSSGGSGAAVAAGQVPLALGSDTNGSIRVPASLCGIFGLKPTYGRLPRTGSFPFVHSLDHLGPFARSAADLALCYDVLQGPDSDDPACAQRPLEATLGQLPLGADDLRVGILDGWFREYAGREARAAVAAVARALQARETVTLPNVAAARAAAFLIGNAEGGALHLDDLRTRAGDFEPLSRDRFIAGALLPAAWIVRAQRVRRWFARELATVFSDFDILLAPATPLPATPIGSETMQLGAERIPTRPNMGILTQPISCIGLPVCVVPVWLPDARLPIGVQVIAAPWREDLVLRVAAQLEADGIAAAPVASLEAASADAVAAV